MKKDERLYFENLLGMTTTKFIHEIYSDGLTCPAEYELYISLRGFLLVLPIYVADVEQILRYERVISLEGQDFKDRKDYEFYIREAYMSNQDIVNFYIARIHVADLRQQIIDILDSIALD